VKDRGDDPQRISRQQIFLRALRTVPGLEIHLGNYQETTVWRPLANPPRRGSRFVQVLWSEEKGSDVNLATQLLMDTYEGRCERAAVISNDSDLAMPIAVAARRLERESLSSIRIQARRHGSLRRLRRSIGPSRTGRSPRRSSRMSSATSEVCSRSLSAGSRFRHRRSQAASRATHLRVH
jgi:hypothetical protein